MEGGGGSCFDECNFEKGLTWSWKEEGHLLVMEGVGAVVLLTITLKEILTPTANLS